MIEFVVDSKKCTRCGECVKDCPVGIIALEDSGPALIADKAKLCLKCQHCLAVCPTAALSVLGKNPADSQVLAGHLPTAEQVEALIRGRRSVRRFAPEPIASDTINKLLRTAAHAPTGHNNLGVVFTVIEDPATMKQLREETLAGIREAVEGERLPKGMEFFAGIVKAWDRGTDVIFRDAPHLVIVSAPKSGPTPAADGYIALCTFELLASSLGLGTLWDGLATWALVDIAPQVGAKLGIPETHELVYTMLFGQPAVKYHRTVQRDQDANIQQLIW
ncbi:MAG: nitroreductase [Desulfuromonadales bacterium C00003094]|jgi:nitroreductase/NAD-dependent dihydropyrimidine dehydrogenase PreA subunit|nr:MAG: nitroreductase [Desulfuromonadales bacterium C00003094]OEU73336.1 MAG: nitroreductase [Desulfuromonadales bacterium C00003107]